MPSAIWRKMPYSIAFSWNRNTNLCIFCEYTGTLAIDCREFMFSPFIFLDDIVFDDTFVTQETIKPYYFNR